MDYRLLMVVEVNALDVYMVGKSIRLDQRLSVGSRIMGLPEPLFGTDDKPETEIPGGSCVRFLDETPGGHGIAVLWPAEAHGVRLSRVLDSLLVRGWSVLRGGDSPGRPKMSLTGPMAPAVEAQRIPDHPSCGAGCDFCFEWALDH